MQTNTSWQHIFRVALPIILASLVQFIVTFVDNAFLSRIDEVAFTAAGNSGMIYISLMMIAQGLSGGTQILVARRNGEKDFKKAGMIFYHSLLLFLLLSLLLFSLMHFGSGLLLKPFIDSEPIYNNMVDFLTIRSFGYFFGSINLLFAAFYIGIARTSILFWTTGITAISNIVLDYGLIFGNFGFPEMQLEGAALASVIAEGLATVTAIVYTFFNASVGKYQLLRNVRKIYKKLFQRILRFSIPLMAQDFLALSAWAIFFLIIEKMGQQALTISHIVRNIYLLALVGVIGFSQSVKTFVSTLLAEGRPEKIKPVVIRSIILSVLITIILIHGIILYPDFLIGIFTSDVEIVAGTKQILNVVTANLFLFCITSNIYSIVSGSGNTRMAFTIEFFTISTYLFCSYLLAVVFALPLPYVWLMEYIYFGLLGILSVVYLRRGTWKTTIV